MLLQVDESVVLRGVLPLVAGSVLVYYLFASLFQTKATLNVPRAGSFKRGGGVNGAAQNTLEILSQNYHKYRNKFFKIDEAYGELVVLPPQYLEELKALPQDVLSFETALAERMHGDLTYMKSNVFGINGRTFPHSINQNLTRSLNGLMETIHDECKYAFDQHVGACEEWTEVNIFHKLVVIVALISGRVFIGPELNRDPEYMRCIIQYTLEVFQSIGALSQVHPWLRSLYARMGWVPELNKVYASHQSMRKIMRPIVEQRLEQMEAGEELPNDMLTWNMLNSNPDIRKSIKAQAHTMLQASMAAIHTTSMTGSHVLYDLAARPELVKPLRDELEAVLAKDKTPYLSKTSTPKLRLLDSFCKESQRVNPLGELTFNRKAMKDITLHDGTVLPKGTQLAVASAQIGKDGENYANPTVFDPWRFVKLREQPGHESRHQFVTTSTDSLSFGYGNHACPGRFFANNELKVIVSYVLLNYDIKMPPGEGRPKNIATSGGARPDTSKCMLMRKREEVAE